MILSVNKKRQPKLGYRFKPRFARMSAFHEQISADKNNSPNREKGEEQKFGNARCRPGDSGKTQKSRDDRDHKKRKRPFKHSSLLFTAL
jgi:hypothetical protein